MKRIKSNTKNQVKKSGRINNITASILITTAIIITTIPQLQAEVALLINGGKSPHYNYCYYYQDLIYMNLILGDNWNKLTLTDDGLGADGPVNGIMCNNDGKFIKNESLSPILTRLHLPGSIDGAARITDIDNHIKNIIDPKKYNLQQNEPILFYFTDHGLLSPEPIISLWGEDLTISKLKIIIEQIPLTNPVILMTDTCYGTNQLVSLMKSRDNFCGFSDSGMNQLSWTNFGMAKNFNQTVSSVDLNHDQKQSFLELFIRYKNNLPIDSNTTPTATSEIFLSNYFNKYHSDFPIDVSIEKTQIITDGDFSQLAGKLLRSERIADIKQIIAEIKQEILANQDIKLIANISSYNDLQSYPAILDQEIERLEKELNKFNINLSPLVFKYAEMVAHQQKIIPQNILLEYPLPLLSQEEAQAIYKITQPIFESLKPDQQIIKTIPPLFLKYIKSITLENSKAIPQFEFVPDIINHYNKLIIDSKNYKKRKNKFKRMVQLIEKINALNIMGKKSDKQALVKLLKIRECESTIVR